MIPGFVLSLTVATHLHASAVTGYGLGATNTQKTYAEYVLWASGQSVSVGIGAQSCGVGSGSQAFKGKKVVDSLGWFWDASVFVAVNDLRFPCAANGSVCTSSSLQQWKVQSIVNGATGGTEPTWPASPTVGVTTVSENSGNVVWVFNGNQTNRPYDQTLPASTTLSEVPLTCPLRPIGHMLVPPWNIQGLDISQEAANAYMSLNGGLATGPTVRDLASGISGSNLAGFNVGTQAYAYWKWELQNALAIRGTGNVAVLAELFTHGESDAIGSTPGSYLSVVLPYKANVDADIAAIYPWQPAGSIKMFVSQQNTWPAWNAGYPYSSQDQVTVAATSGFVGTDANYAYSRTAIGQGPHLDAVGYQTLGEKDTEAINAVVHGQSWTPLTPILASITVGGTGNKTITIPYNVQVGPMVFLAQDKIGNAVADPHPGGGSNPQWTGMQGFEAVDLPTTVSSAVLTTTPITITVASASGWNASGDRASTPCGTWPVTVSGNVLTLTGSTGSSSCSFWTPSAGQKITRVLPITSAAVSGSSVVVTLTNTPSTGLRVQYAWTPDDAATANPGGMYTGCRYGFLYDSDTYVGPLSGYRLRASGWQFQSPSLL